MTNESPHGAQEPAHVRTDRDTYWRKEHERERLETRIGMTERGYEWLLRVKRIGRP